MQVPHDSSWIEQTLAHGRFKDARHRKRLALTLHGLDARPDASLPEAMRSVAATKGVYRFLAHEDMDYQTILSALYASTRQRCAEESVVLLLQDTTEFDFTSKPATRKLGHLDHPACRGLKMHSVLAVSTQGVPLGALHMQCYTREAKEKAAKANSSKRALPQKESYRWIQALYAADRQLRHSSCLRIHIADREADFFELFAAPRAAETDLLMRVHYNRRVLNSELKMMPSVLQQPVLGRRSLMIPRRQNRPARMAELSLRVAELQVQPPDQHRKRLLPQPMHVIHVCEEKPPEGQEPIEWWLLTTLAVTTAEEAFECVRYYTYRWLIERFHYTLKSGCNVEDLQLKEYSRLCSAIATYSYIAWRLLWLTYESRQNPEQSCEVALSRAQWQALWCYHHQKRIAPEEPPRLQEAIIWIAQLGGFLARRGDGPPGVKTLWKGWRALSDITASYLLFNPDVSNDTSYG